MQVAGLIGLQALGRHLLVDVDEGVDRAAVERLEGLEADVGLEVGGDVGLGGVARVVQRI